MNKGAFLDKKTKQEKGAIKTERNAFVTDITKLIIAGAHNTCQ